MGKIWTLKINCIGGKKEKHIQAEGGEKRYEERRKGGKGLASRGIDGFGVWFILKMGKFGVETRCGEQCLRGTEVRG